MENAMAKAMAKEKEDEAEIEGEVNVARQQEAWKPWMDRSRSTQAEIQSTETENEWNGMTGSNFRS